MNGREQFRQIIEAETHAGARAETSDLLEPLHDLVGAINDRGVGAELVARTGGRLTLTLWPLHRPNLRSVMLPFARRRGEISALLESGRRSFHTADELRSFLHDFAAREEFKASLAHLREEASQPVEAVLASTTNHVLAEIGADDQRRLGEAARGQELELELAIGEGERLPNDFKPTTLSSAGLYFDVLSAGARGRVLSLKVRPLHPDELHEVAANLAEQGRLARAGGDAAGARELYARALQRERLALRLLAAGAGRETNRPALLCSAARLALGAGELGLARQLIEEALTGDPPAELRNELEALRQEVVRKEANDAPSASPP